VEPGDRVGLIRVESEQLRSLVFSRDSRSVAAAGKGAVIRIWDVLTGQELLSLKDHKTQINALTFSPDGSVFASCSHDGAVRLWHASAIDPLAKP
jgi:WD40 repeat protein